MQSPIPFWTKAPFLRLLIPFITGIWLEWKYEFESSGLWILLSVSTMSLALYSLLPLGTRFRKGFLAGACIHLLMAALGAILLFMQDIRHDPQWMGYAKGNMILARMTEPPAARAHSYKALATVLARSDRDSHWKYAKGKLVIYFSLNCVKSLPATGERILLSALPEPVKNTGNPGGFDYAGYCLFQRITHQVYLDTADYMLPATKPSYGMDVLVYQCRQYIVQLLKKYIIGAREQGLAEALLIGYKDDLDKDLVRSYSDTGVVHIIAISGMHLALIYGMLLWLTGKMGRYKKLQLLRLLLVLSGLWLFTLMAGAQASVVRSAVMFTCIALSGWLERKTSIYNTLALSAFLLLCFRPCWLWDAGFQLSYAAVISIVLLYRPIYGWLFFTNKMVDAVWKTAAISMAAQIFTTPFSLYYFHQFPLLFVFTNLAAVPLSSVVLFALILLCLLAFIPLLASPLGSLVSFLIICMNSCIEIIREVPFSLLTGISISAVQASLLLVMAAATCSMAVNKKASGKIVWLVALGGFTGLHSMSLYHASMQQQLVVYNIQGRKAIHFINGRAALLLTDTMEKNDQPYLFSIAPSNIVYHIRKERICRTGNADLDFAGRKIVLISHPILLGRSKKNIDLLIVSGQKKVDPNYVLEHLHPDLVIVDASVPDWRRKEWSEACREKNFRYYCTADEGGFVMNFQHLPL